MNSEITLGTFLVLTTWLFLLVIVGAMGTLPTILLSRKTRGLEFLRSSLWWGIGILGLLSAVLSLYWPLASPLVGIALVIVGVAAGVTSAIVLRRIPTPQQSDQPKFPRLPRLILAGAFTAMVLFLAASAIGPATNYDTGLYHFGFIQYLRDYGTVTGLANLSVPFGYANLQFPLAALFSTGPWGDQGWRLLNGFFLVGVLLELLMRLRPRVWSWGTWVLLVGVGATAIPLIAMADSFVTSPTSDTAVLLLTLISTAYLCDLLELQGSKLSAVVLRGRAVFLLSVIIVTTGLSIAMRPTMLAYAAGVALILVIWVFRQRAIIKLPRSLWIWSGLWLSTLGIIQIFRDYYLSGWLLYPLSIYKWDVSWTARDPTELREATLAAARNPQAEDGYQVAHSWDWIGAWLLRLPEQWEPWFLGVGFITFLALALIARSAVDFPQHPGRIAQALMPSGIAILAWFLFSPPSFRFIWGPLFALFIIVIAAALQELNGKYPVSQTLLLGVSSAVLVVTAFSWSERTAFEGLTPFQDSNIKVMGIDLSVVPLPDVEIQSEVMPSGVTIRKPLIGDQCWGEYPLCTFVVSEGISLRGENIGDGFLTVRGN